MLCSFFIKAAVLMAVPMFGGEGAEEQNGKPKYSAVDVEEINRRKEDDQQGAGPERSAAGSTAVDPTLVEQKDDLSINSPDELVTKKIEGARDIEQKWKTKMEQWALRSGIDSIQEEERAKIGEEAAADLEYWTHQNENVSSLFAENHLETARRELFLTLATAATQAMQQAQEVIDFCDSGPSLAKITGLTSPQTSANVSRATSPSISKTRRTSDPSLFSLSEKLEQLTAAVHAAAHTSQKGSAYDALDERFRESLKNWTDRENARLKYETAIKEHESAQEELKLQKDIRDKTNSEKTVAAEVSRCARICSYIFGCINIPFFNVAAFFTGAAGLANEANKEIIDHPLHRAEANERRAAAAVEGAKRVFENMQAEAPEFQEETERLEQEARLHEKKEIMELAKKIVPPLDGDSDVLWNQWASGIVEISSFNPSWGEVLARHGQQDHNWVLEQITSAWGKRIEHLEQYVATLKNQTSPEQKEKEKLAKEALKKGEAAAVVKKIVSDDQEQIAALTQSVALARQNLADANQELDVLEQAPVVGEKKGGAGESSKGIASMDASLNGVSKQWTKIKEFKAALKDVEAQLQQVKLHCQEQEPIAAEKEIDFNTSLKKYQRYAEQLDRNIERATARLEANCLAGQSILDLPAAVPMREMIVGVEGALGPVEHTLVKLLPQEQNQFRSISDELTAEDEGFIQYKINADLLEERQQVSRLGLEEKEESDGDPSPSKENILRKRKSSLTAIGKVSSELNFPSVSRLSEKSFEYLQQLHHSVDSREKRGEEHSSSGDSSFQTVLSLEMPAEVVHSEDGDIGLPLTPNIQEVQRQQSLVMDARNQAARKSAKEALPEWSKAIAQANNLTTTYQQVIEANEQALISLDREVAIQKGSETAPQTARRMMLTANLEQAKEKKSDWMLKLCSYKADQASDLAIYEATLPTLTETGSHQKNSQRAQEAVAAYSALKELCIKTLREHLAVSPALQSSWMKLLEETVQDEQHWREKLKKGNTPRAAIQDASKEHDSHAAEEEKS